MSTHRKIEWSQFILGLIGVSLSIWFDHPSLQIILFSIGALFAGLHVVHAYNGQKANRIIAATSGALIFFLVYSLLIPSGLDADNQTPIFPLIVAVLLLGLCVRLRRDFIQR